jgi:NADH-quinone oxidoreductase subunit J
METFSAVVFYALAATAIAAALVMITQRNPIGSAFAFIVVLCSLSAIYGLLGSPFIAALQIVVYAGAIMVLFLFVIMLLNAKREDHPPGQGRLLGMVAGGLVALLAAEVASVLLGARLQAVASYEASTLVVARELFAPHFLYAFEATSVLILSALVGAIVLAKKEL